MTELALPTIILFYDKHNFETLKVFENVKSLLVDKAVFISLNMKRHPESFATFKVKDLPSVVAFLNGNELWRVCGNISEEIILQNF